MRAGRVKRPFGNESATAGSSVEIGPTMKSTHWAWAPASPPISGSPGCSQPMSTISGPTLESGRTRHAINPATIQIAAPIGPITMLRLLRTRGRSTVSSPITILASVAAQTRAPPTTSAARRRSSHHGRQRRGRQVVLVHEARHGAARSRTPNSSAGRLEVSTIASSG